MLAMTVLVAKLDRRRTLAVSIAAAGLTLLALFACAGRAFELSVLFLARGLAACAYVVAAARVCWPGPGSTCHLKRCA